MNETIEQARKEVYHYTKGTAGGFATALIDLMGKADAPNRFNIAKGFPLVSQAVSEWQGSKDDQDFFNKYIKEK